jgi:uncharacterized protein YjbI with pentapeptide repeats
MADPDQVKLLKRSVKAWNKFRAENPNIIVDLSDVNLIGVDLKGAYLSGTDLRRTDLRGTDLRGTHLIGADLSGVHLHGANLSGANLSGANLSGVHVNGANLSGANLSGANLSGARINNTNLSRVTLVNTNIEKAIITGSQVYGVNIWDIKGEFLLQSDLVITRPDDPIITVDNIEVAQFIYLILNNEKIRNVINSITSKAVLILGRFTGEGRKSILDELKNRLREFNLLPIVFNFDRPDSRDFTETIKTLAGLSYFVIADITNPKSSLLELQATVPDYQVPFLPIIQKEEEPFSMFVDLQNKYDWVLPTLTYDSKETLIKALKPAIIDRAIKKHNELILIKAKKPTILDAKDFLH